MPTLLLLAAVLLVLIGSLLLVFVIDFLQWDRERRAVPRVDLGDPYLLAYLHGGAARVTCAAIVSLLEKGLITEHVVPGTVSRLSATEEALAALLPIERRVYDALGDPTARAVVSRARAGGWGSELRAALELAGALPDPAVRRKRLLTLRLATVSALLLALWIWVHVAGGLLSSLACLAAMLPSLAVAWLGQRRRRTPAGDRALAAARDLYQPLLTRTDLTGRERVLVAALFGRSGLRRIKARGEGLFTRTGASGDCGAVIGLFGGCASVDGHHGGSSHDGGSSHHGCSSHEGGSSCSSADGGSSCSSGCGGGGGGD